MLIIKDIRKVWELVRPGLDVERARCGSDWRPEDVYKLCVDNVWTLLMDESPECDGFVMVSKGVCPFTGTVRLVLEAGYYNGDVPVFERFWKDLCHLADAIGATEMELQTNRTGFERLGWKPVQKWQRFRKEVRDGQ